MKIGILSIGAELLRGATINTNFASIASELNAFGAAPCVEVCASDSESSIRGALEWLSAQCDVIISTGGLGPTSDDISKTVVARHFGLELEENAAEKEKIRSFISGRFGDTIPSSVFNQAMLPKGAEILENKHGTAPGIHIRDQKRKLDLFMLPGPPREAIPMLKECVVPRLRGLLTDPIFTSSAVFVGIPESIAEEKVKGFFENEPDAQIAYCASLESLVITVSSPKRSVVSEKIAEIRRILADHAIAEGSSNLMEEIVCLLKSRGKSLALAESCTGGMISEMICSVPGASEVFLGGAVAYSNELKYKILGVSSETLARHGAVSSECAAEMSAKFAEKCGADYCVSVTGVAGPGGGSPEKPVGLVYIGIHSNVSNHVSRHIFSGDRANIRRRAATTALNKLRKAILSF